MSDVSAPVGPNPDWPPLQFPVLFADGALSTAWATGIVKFYFYRSDPEYRALPNTGSRDMPNAQVVMPTAGFVAMAALFERTVQRLIDQKMISEAEVARIRAIQGSPYAS
jgi:hypothetical protein